MWKNGVSNPAMYKMQEKLRKEKCFKWNLLIICTTIIYIMRTEEKLKFDWAPQSHISHNEIRVARMLVVDFIEKISIIWTVNSKSENSKGGQILLKVQTRQKELQRHLYESIGGYSMMTNMEIHGVEVGIQ